MTVIEMMKKRSSIRKYKNEKLGERLAEVEGIVAEARRLYSEIPMEAHIIRDGEGFQEIIRGIVGSYGKVKAPHYIVVTSEKREGYKENIGFTLEQAVLRLTEMGLGTCWIGASVEAMSTEKLSKFTKLREGQTPVIMIAFGWPAEELPSEIPDSARKRKPLSELITGTPEGKWQSVMETVRIAPSAINIQPWRINLSKDSADFYAYGGNVLVKNLFAHYMRLDTGIGLAHAYLAAEHYGMKIELKKLAGKEKPRMEYVTSIVESR